MMSYFTDHCKEIREYSSEMTTNIMTKFKKDVEKILEEKKIDIGDITGVTKNGFNFLFQAGYGINILVLTEIASSLGYKLEINLIKDENK